MSLFDLSNAAFCSRVSLFLSKRTRNFSKAWQIFWQIVTFSTEFSRAKVVTLVVTIVRSTRSIARQPSRNL